jgi:hypothetical protein
MRKINLTDKKLRFNRLVQKKFFSFRSLYYHGSFGRRKFFLFKNFALRRMVFPHSIFSKKKNGVTLALSLKGTRFLKLLIKNTHFIRRFYCDMKQHELERWGKAFRQKFKYKKRFGFCNLLYNLDLRLNSFLLHQGLVNSVDQLKQFILHGKVNVNGKIIKGYNFRTHLLDFVSIDPQISKDFRLQRSWYKFFYFKVLRLRLQTRSLATNCFRLNLFNEILFSSWNLINFGKLGFFINNSFIFRNLLKDYFFLNFNDKFGLKNKYLFKPFAFDFFWISKNAYFFWKSTQWWEMLIFGSDIFEELTSSNKIDTASGITSYLLDLLVEQKRQLLWWRWFLLLQSFSFSRFDS